MAFFSKIISWSLLVSISSWAIAHAQFRADPTDDFSFIYSKSSKNQQTFDLMSAGNVEQILIDHIDLLPRSESRKLAHHLLRLCRTYRFDPAFILSMVQVESGFRVKIESSAGAIGLMQLMPATAQVVAKRFGVRYTGARSLTDPFVNLSLGVAYLSYLRQKYEGQSPYFHIAAYNLGPAKLDELRSQKSFKPTNTKIYYEKIKKGVPKLRFYNVESVGALKAKGSFGV